MSSVPARSDRLRSRLLMFLVCFGAVLSPPSLLAAGLPHARPDEVGLDGERLDRIEALVTAGIEAGEMPGCVVCVGRHGHVAYLRAFGNRQEQPEVEAMTTDTLFDMASITKPVATATSVMKLLEGGYLRLDDKVADHFPDFASHGKDEIAIRDLLIHQSGLIADNPLSDYKQGPENAWKSICDLELSSPVGERFRYSDVNFIVLGQLVQHLSGKSVHEFSRDEIFQPLGMTATGYLPSEELKARAAPTEQRDGAWIRGEVHDPRAYLMDGVAGHAGLFSTAEDLAIYAQMMIGGGTYTPADGGEAITILGPRTVATMTRAYPVSRGTRGLGWDKQSSYSSNRGDLLSEAAFGHGGFTGTVLWIDPDLDLFFVFLANRLHPDGKGAVNSLAGQIANVVAGAITDAGDRAAGAGQVLTGIDVLVRDGFRPLRGQRVGLITNQTGRAEDGTSTVALLHGSPDVALTALFSPEHGFEGKLDIAHVADSQDAATGLRVHSLYGETRRPTAEMLADVDTLVFDIQDIGCRFYTYISTMGEAMQAAAEHGKRFVVLDRPNPIGGTAVAGPMLDAGAESFVGFHHLPVRHGMTIGELARMIRGKSAKLDLHLTVIACEGWSRDQAWEQTGLTWVNPSPNMRSLTQAFLYPGVGLLETTNVSVGRGTDTPFEVLGAPWIDGRRLASRLNARGLPGVAFVPIEFTPESSKFADQECKGINIIVTDRQWMEPLRVGLAIAVELRSLYPDAWNTKSLPRLLGDQAVHDAIVDGRSLAAVMELTRDGVDAFIARRAEYLLYP